MIHWNQFWKWLPISLFSNRCSNNDATETVRFPQPSLEIPGHDISSIYTSKNGTSTPVHLTTDTKSSSSVQAIQSSFQKQLGNIQNLIISAWIKYTLISIWSFNYMLTLITSGDSTSMAAAFPLLAAAGLASRSPFSLQNLSNGLHPSNTRVPASNAILDLHTQTILNMFRSAQHQHQSLIKVSTSN